MPAILAAVLNCSVRPGLVPEFTQHRARQVRVEFAHALSPTSTWSRSSALPTQALQKPVDQSGRSVQARIDEREGAVVIKHDDSPVAPGQAGLDGARP
ncbi:hypothetical protein [Streptomyces fructofermentans]|uniref:hypothetical protein n=1 Tax=Streptomyces fructofermentans TaxID=152141 RepID=UPI0033C5779E